MGLVGGVGLFVVEWSVCCSDEVSALGRFTVDFWGTQGQRVSRAGPLPSQSSGWSHSPVKAAGERQIFLSGYQHHGKPPAHQRNPETPQCVGVWLWGRDVRLGQVRVCSCPSHCPTAQTPHLGLRPKQPLQDMNS